MQHTITINRSESVFLNETQCYKLVLEAESTNTDPAVFILHRRYTHIAEQYEDIFQAIATPVQLEDIPKSAPVEGSQFFRTDKIAVVFRTPEALVEFEKTVMNEIQMLIRDLDALDELTATTKVRISAKAFTTIID